MGGLLVLYENIDQILPINLQNRCEMCIQWTHLLYFVVIK